MPLLVAGMFGEEPEHIEIPEYSEPVTNEDRVKLIIEEFGFDLPEYKQTQLLETLGCESMFQSIQSRLPLVQTLPADYVLQGEPSQEQSFGVAQIHLPAHPEVYLWQAMDREFAVKWTIEEFRQGNESQWSCWRNKYSI